MIDAVRGGAMETLMPEAKAHAMPHRRGTRQRARAARHEGSCVLRRSADGSRKHPPASVQAVRIIRALDSKRGRVRRSLLDVGAK